MMTMHIPFSLPLLPLYFYTPFLPLSSFSLSLHQGFYFYGLETTWRSTATSFFLLFLFLFLLLSFVLFLLLFSTQGQMTRKLGVYDTKRLWLPFCLFCFQCTIFFLSQTALAGHLGLATCWPFFFLLVSYLCDISFHLSVLYLLEFFSHVFLLLPPRMVLYFLESDQHLQPISYCNGTPGEPLLISCSLTFQLFSLDSCRV